MPKKILTLPGTFIFWISIFTRERFWQEREREMIMLLIQKSLTADQLAGQELWYWININPMGMYCWSIILPSWDKSLSFPETTPIPRDTLKATTNPLIYTVHVPVLPINSTTFSSLWQPLITWSFSYEFQFFDSMQDSDVMVR